MSLRSNLFASVAALPLVFAAQEAGAAAYTFSSTGSFTDVMGANLGSGGTKIGWGGSNSVNSQNYNGSSMVATPLNNQTGNTPATADQIGQIVWNNASTPSDATAAVVSAIYRLAMNFTQPSPGGTGSNTFDLAITNTANNARVCFFFSCRNTGDVNDTASISDYAGSFTINGLTLSNISFVESGDGSFSAGTGIWSNPENGTSTLRIYANIDVAPTDVPEPASLALLGSGLLGLGLVRRSRRQA